MMAATDGSPLVVAVDPGGTTGLATYREGGLPFVSDGSVFASSQVDRRLDVPDALAAMALHGCPMVVVVERFIINAATARKSAQPDALLVCGALEYMSHRNGWTFILQKPADAKTFSTDDKLKSLGWYRPGMGHANDAARHLLLALVRSGNADVLAGAV